MLMQEIDLGVFSYAFQVVLANRMLFEKWFNFYFSRANRRTVFSSIGLIIISLYIGLKPLRRLALQSVGDFW
jgi:hypothetical protein